MVPNVKKIGYWGLQGFCPAGTWGGSFADLASPLLALPAHAFGRAIRKDQNSNARFAKAAKSPTAPEGQNPGRKNRF
jgi:hypothetical protein